MPKYISLHFLTMDIIHLQAKQPDTNAARKPITIADAERDVEAPCSARYSALGEMKCLTSSNASPKMGGITIRKENWASFSFLLPNSKPVAIVLPLLLKPGNTATACAIPIIKE